MAIGTKRLRMTDGADLLVPACRVFMFVEKVGCVIVNGIRLLRTLERSIQMTVGTERFSLGERFRVSG
jgi:hypothetical protein